MTGTTAPVLPAERVGKMAGAALPSAEIRVKLRCPDKATHLPRRIAAVAAIMLRVAGIAAVIAGTPGLTETEISAKTQTSAPQVERGAGLGEKCAECGVVESFREIGQAGEGVDAVAGEVAEKGATRYEVTIRMKDGASRVIIDANPANWREGERVTLIDGPRSPND